MVRKVLNLFVLGGVGPTHDGPLDMNRGRRGGKSAARYKPIATRFRALHINELCSAPGQVSPAFTR